MNVPIQLERVELGDTSVSLFVPDPVAIQELYNTWVATERSLAFPYWARIWPSALALSKFLIGKPDLYSGKTVIELAAGVGLPSLVVARLAARVISSDYHQDAVDTIRKSVQYNRYTNMEVLQLDWNCLPSDLNGDLLLLSDINYDPAAFGQLELLLKQFIASGTTILLSTPQRLMAKPFINAIDDYIKEQENISLFHQNAQTEISILLLKK